MNTFKEKTTRLFRNKVCVSLVVVVGLSIIGLSAYLLITRGSNFSKESTVTNSSDFEFEKENLTLGEPYLLLTITDYPLRINYLCQNVIIFFEAENVGDTVLNYSDLGDEYYFKVISNDTLDGSMPIGVVDTTEKDSDDVGLIPYTKLINDFGEILPGEKKSVTFNCLNYVIEDQHNYFWVNSFFGIPNGSADYYIQFGKLSEKGMFYNVGISDSLSVNIVTDLKDVDGGEKACSYKLIEDMSMDFYK